MNSARLKLVTPLLGALLFAPSVPVHAETAPAPLGLHPIGSQKQFFFDDEMVETMERTARRLNTTVKVTPNPVIVRDRPWEGPDIRVNTVFFDALLGKLRMRYSTGIFVAKGRDEKGEIIVAGDSETVPRQVCEAYSTDGIHWEKPNLGLVEFKGSKNNNIVPESMALSYMFQDLHDPDPARRYKAQIRKGTYKGKGMTFDYYYSADAFHWTPYSGNPVIDTGDHDGRWGPTTFLGWDPIRRMYAVHMENNFHMHSTYARRSIGRAESADMVHWSDPETIIVADTQDYPDTEFYAMPTAFYEGWYIGYLWIFSTTNTTHEPQFVFSRDGVHYNRTYRDPIIRRGDNGDFDAVSLYAQEPIVFNGQIYCYYTGTNWRSPETLVELGDKATAGIGLARLPLDGFVSLEGARHDFSVVTTRSLTFTGTNLFLNVQAALQQWGAEPCEVRVELLDGRLAPIAGYGMDDADPVTKTSSDQRISWKGKTDISALAGHPIRLRIHFKNAKLYAFQFR